MKNFNKRISLLPKHFSQDETKVADLYSAISVHYDDWFRSGWPEPAEIQGKALNEIVKKQGLMGRLRVLDLTCGVGVQSVGMALLGHKVVALDISEGQLKRASHEVEKLNKGLDIEFVHGNAITPIDDVDGPFDLIMSFGNSIPLLGSADAIENSMKQSHDLLSENGMLVISMRDHTNLRARKPHLIDTGPVNNGDRKGVWVETGEWQEDGRRYISHIIFTLTAPKHMDYHYPFPPLDAITKDEFMDMLGRCGYRNIEFHSKETNPEFTAPLYIARK